MDFLERAVALYSAINAHTAYWMLARPAIGPGFINTKMNPITLADYGDADGLRGPAFTYGWIQGRGLEALATHATWFESELPPLGAKIDATARTLMSALDGLREADGHVYFCYDADMVPVRGSGSADLLPQERPADIFTYSDAFAAKGLVAAKSRYAPAEAGDTLAAFDRVISAIEDGRFQMDEKQPLSAESLADQADDFGPRMILLGAAGMLDRLGHAGHLSYADRFIAHVLSRHFDPAAGLLRNVPGEDACNVGHGIEFVGFALDYLIGRDIAPDLLNTLETILLSSFEKGFVGPGLALSVSLKTGTAINPLCPWWSLPEAIRAAALLYERTGNARTRAVWEKAHDAFIAHYWRGTPPVAYQTMDADGPVDFVPATPDLDPNYHTGLSLLAAIGVAGRAGTSTFAHAG
ncbi:AGE family epimerase/isomerase [Martelella mediterranea]|uniref:N-acylglucosamine 2-epimerase (GlcNAc 2-epimerase) n=1 Tax=Martelella mediterranea DSM 17316 TaxID=1122214 RepID=A0A1U9ZA11_9HYPH|nr:AGE family epimerase/isomerase [Martelella mediterranea]AQZ54524.1 N-acylglucosamine 2-epimerase (GlcNAc 2-epimerase) [Martelella mediterranea DSM 17316]